MKSTKAIRKDAKTICGIFDVVARRKEIDSIPLEEMENLIHTQQVIMAKEKKIIMGVIIRNSVPPLPTKIHSIVVLPEYRKKGVGTFLVNEFCVDPIISNIGNKTFGFWEKLGFIKTGNGKIERTNGWKMSKQGRFRFNRTKFGTEIDYLKR